MLAFARVVQVVAPEPAHRALREHVAVGVGGVRDGLELWSVTG